MNTFSVICEKNCEKLCSKELSKRFSLKSKEQEGFVDFHADDTLAIKVTYFSQSAKRVLLKIGSGTFSDLNDLTKQVEKLIDNDHFLSYVISSYRVSCERLGVHDFNSVIVEQEISGSIKKVLLKKNKDVKADYNTNDLIFYVYLNDNNYLFGIDYAGKDLSKRHYLFFNNSIAVKGTLAFNLLMFSGFKQGLSLLDCFALAGVITIEAAVFEKNSSINAFSKDFFFPIKVRSVAKTLLEKFDSEVLDSKFNNIFSCDSSFPNLAAQKKNARIAGVEKSISFSRIDVVNIDLKNFSKPIDLVCSRIIEPSKKISERVARKTYEHFFSATKQFLSNKGSVNVVVRVPDLVVEVANNYGFVLKDKLLTSQGKQDFFFLKFSPK